MSVLNNIQDGISTIETFISQNPLASVGVATATGVAVGGIVGSVITKKIAKRKKKTAKSKKKSAKSRKRKLKFGSKAYRKKYLGKHRRKQKQPRTAGKRKDTSHRRIRYTKNNQPYVILPNGRARFIKRSSVRASRKRKGGRY